LALARDAREVIEIYRQGLELGQLFNLVFLDLTIPGGLSGKEPVKNLISLDPNVIALVSSGYTESLIVSEYKKYGFSGVIENGYKIEDLSQISANLLRRKPA
jgi:two-component system cell cycle sensor histidine kinase/response regulator CckA